MYNGCTLSVRCAYVCASRNTSLSGYQIAACKAMYTDEDTDHNRHSAHFMVTCLYSSHLWYVVKYIYILFAYFIKGCKDVNTIRQWIGNAEYIFMFGDQYWVICRSSRTKAVSLCLRYDKQQKLTNKCSRVPHRLTWTPFLSVSTAASPYLYPVWWPLFENWKGTLSQMGTHFAHWSPVWMYTPCLYLCTYVCVYVCIVVRHYTIAKDTTFFKPEAHFWAQFSGMGVRFTTHRVSVWVSYWGLSTLCDTKQCSPHHELAVFACRELGQAGLSQAIESGPGWPKSL